MHAIIIRYSEVGLKGKNRIFYERRLSRNIRLCLKDNSLSGEVRRIRGRIIVLSEEESAAILLKNIFGIASLSYAEVHEPEIAGLKEAVLAYAKQRKFDSFRITVQRLNTDFPCSSLELERQLGEVVFEAMKKKVSLKEPELNIQLEMADKAYLFSEKTECFGGLPIGTQGRALCLLDPKDRYSLLSAALMMRRGCTLSLCAQEELDFSGLQKYCYGMIPKLILLKNLGGLDSLAQEAKAKAIVVPDRLDSIADYKTKTTVLRPLVGFGDKELKEEYARYFG